MGGSTHSSKRKRRASNITTVKPVNLHKEDDNPVKASRASPPPMDDFDMDAADDAKWYKNEQEIETARQRIRDENKARKKRGERPLKLPAKPKRDSTSRRHREEDTDDDPEEYVNSNVEEVLGPRDYRDLKYIGQVKLGFNPLEELAKLEDGEVPDVEKIKKPLRQQNPDKPLKNPMDNRAPAALGNGLLKWPKKETGKFPPLATVAGGVKEEPDVKPITPPDIKPRVTSDVKPAMPPDTKPTLSAGTQPVLSDRNNPSSQDVRAGATTDAENDGDNAESEEEEYGSDDDIVAPWGQSRPSQPVKQEPVEVDEAEESEDEIYSEDEVAAMDVEELYSEDELYDSSLTTNPSASQSKTAPLSPTSHALETGLVPVGSMWLSLGERPAFTYTEAQREIGPHSIDPDDPNMVIPAPINRYLREYQRGGVEFFYERYKRGYGGILGDDMGLGKTVQVIAFLSAIMRKTGTTEDIDRRKLLVRGTDKKTTPKKWPTALIICPTSLVDNWKRELETWGYFEFEVLGTNTCKQTIHYMRNGYLDLILASNEVCIRNIDELRKAPLSVVIVDEAHRMKTPNGRLALATKMLKADACFALTGTLMQNRMDEMWSILDFVHRGWAGTLKEWKTFAAKPVNEGHRSDGSIAQVVLAIKRIGQLKERILPHFYIRRDKSKLAHELPTKRDIILLCPLATQQEAVYQRVVDSEDTAFILDAKKPCDCGSELRRIDCHYQVNSQGDDFKTALLKMFHALGRCANHLALLYSSRQDPPKNREINKRIFEFCVGLPYDPNRHNLVEAALDPHNCGKWDVLKRLLEQWRGKEKHAENNKILVFSNSVRLLKMIYDFIGMTESLSGSGCELFTGEVDKDSRMGIVDRFQDDNGNLSILLVSTMAGGVGLNLTAANKVVIFDPNWNPANDLQAMDRAFRIGQKRPVDVYRLIGQGTVEEMMYERQIYKQQRARQMNLGTFERRTHAGFEGATDMKDKGDLFGVHNLFRYHPGGYVKRSMEGVLEFEDQFRQDMVTAEYDGESEDEDEGVVSERRARDQRRAAQVAADEAGLLDELTSDGMTKSAKTDMDILTSLGISAMDHEKMFRDSPEERELFRIGLELLKADPANGKKLANDVAKLNAANRPAKRARKSVDAARKQEAVDEPWKHRNDTRNGRNRAKQLVELDDDGDEE